jgi:hypothetical protein
MLDLEICIHLCNFHKNANPVFGIHLLCNELAAISKIDEFHFVTCGWRVDAQMLKVFCLGISQKPQDIPCVN